MTATDPLAVLANEGVAVWLDDLSRTRLTSGGLARLVQERHVVGVTSNPSIFANALEDAQAYQSQTADLAARSVGVDEAARMLQTFDVRWACDVLRPTFEASGGRDGRVSIQVDPRRNDSTEGTVAEARQLWWLVDRPNLFIKIPATDAGLPAIAQCLAEGMSINVTLIFSLSRYAQVLQAYLDGMEAALADGRDTSQLASVASFFISRVDTEIDARLDAIATTQALALKGKSALANARLAYQHYESVFTSARGKALVEAGAGPQRPLWASTGVKNPAYADDSYVSGLVAPGVVNTMPETTLNAVADHGHLLGNTIRGSFAQSQQVLDELAELGIDYDEVMTILEQQGMAKFEQAQSRVASLLAERMEGASR